MKWALLLSLHEGRLLFARHPEYLITCGVILFIFFLLRRRATSRRGSSFPVNWPFIGMLPAVIANRHRLLDFGTSLLQQSKDTFMFKGVWFTGMDFLMTCDPRNASHMFNVEFSNYPKGEKFAQIYDVLGNGIICVDGDLWMLQRRMAHAHMSDPKFRPFVAACTTSKVARVLLPLLTHMAGIGEAVDLIDIFTRFTFDATCTLVHGVDPGSLALDFPTIPFAEAVTLLEQRMFFRHIAPMFWWKLLRYLRVGKEGEAAKAVKVVDHYVHQIISERREGVANCNGDRCSKEEEAPFDMLTTFMSSAESSEHCNDDKFLRDILLSFLAAGKDTTGSAMAWLLCLVSGNPHAENNILEELRELLSSAKCSSLDAEMVMFDAEKIDTLVYLHAAVCESLRIYPVLPLNFKEALKADVLPSGHKVQPGTNIIFSNYSVGRMEEIWGPDCSEFRPERWITEQGTLRHFPSNKFISFHSGPKACLGKNVALTQIKILASAIIYNFSIHLVEGYTTEPKVSVVLQPKNGLRVKLTKRSISGY